MLNAVFAVAENGAFGNKGGLPWPHLLEDLKLFKRLTEGTTLVMGRSTYESLPIRASEKRNFLVATTKPLDRFTHKYIYSIHHLGTLDLGSMARQNQTYTIIGGASLLTPEILKHCNNVYVSHIEGSFDHDVALSKRTQIWLETLHSEVLVWVKDKFTCKRYQIERK